MGHVFFLRIYEWSLVSATYFELITKMKKTERRKMLNQHNNLLRFWMKGKG